jgi:Flp pilus assembly protein TadG
MIRRRPRTRADERGSMAVEVVLLVPVLFLFLLLVIVGGRYVSVRADMEAAARDAARAASLERTQGEAESAASAASSAALDGFATCSMSDFDGPFVAGGSVEVEIACDVPNDGLGLLGLSGSVRMTASGAAPLDTYRRTG